MRSETDRFFETVNTQDKERKDRRFFLTEGRDFLASWGKRERRRILPARTPFEREASLPSKERSWQRSEAKEKKRQRRTRDKGEENDTHARNNYEVEQ